MINNTGNSNTGNSNTGNYNTGYYNTGYYNTGYYNTGNSNTGNSNTGYRNTGYCNPGDYNTGDWNTGYYNTGYCNTITPKNILVFNKPAKREDWDNAKKPNWMFFSLTHWVEEEDMSDKEKEAYPSYTTTNGYLKVCTSYKHAAIESWNRASTEDKELTLELPNYDDEVFEEIFGFSAVKELKTNPKITINVDGKEIELSDEICEELRKKLINKE